MDTSGITNLDFASVDAKTITLTSNFATGTSFTLTKDLFTKSGNATISGTAIGNLVDLSTNDKAVMVSSEDGKTTQTYTVILQNTDARITAFDFALNNKGTIAKGKITFAKSFDYATWQKKLTASNVEYSDNATLSFNPKTATDYTTVGKRQITVRAEAGVATKTYKIKVQIKVSDANRFDVVYGEIKKLGGKEDAEYSVDLNHLDMSAVTNMEDLFNSKFGGSKNPTRNRHFARFFNGDIREWNVANVTNMKGLFRSNFETLFNGYINDWDVSKVTNMSFMFYNTKKFNQPLNKWNVFNVENMEHMFDSARYFNQALNGWDVSNVTNMSGMFYATSVFKQPLNKWDVSNVENMNGMFSIADNFNQPLNDWKEKVSKVTNMKSMFEYTKVFNQDLSAWDVSSVTNMTQMFQDTKAFNQDLSGWPTDKVTDCQNFSLGADAYIARKPQKQKASSANCKANGSDW